MILKCISKIEIKTRFGKKVQNQNNFKGSTKHIKKNIQLLAFFNEFALLFFNKRVDQGNFQQGYTGNEQQFLLPLFSQAVARARKRPK